ncbi:MAG: hypothetical protein IPL32_01955 [Chloracidobacterium sp.]|nr:hypothetical protein [Chloracidobacterium sp.]
MTRDDLSFQARQLIDSLDSLDHTSKALASHATVTEFLRVYAGEKSAFYAAANTISPYMITPESTKKRLRELLQSFHSYVESGLHGGVSPERQAQIDVVSDFLEMAASLLHRNDVHPAAPAVLIGATLEEFLRNWVESEKLPLGDKKPGLETYSQVLRDANKLTKQDGKDITSWAGIRNHAAHGEWDEVKDKQRIGMMLESVNLFIRKYSI